MKKLMIAIGMMMSVAAYAQDGIAKFIAKYQDDETFTQVKVSQKMFGLFTNLNIDKPEDKDVLDAISKIQGLTVLAKQQTRDSRALYKEALTYVPKTYEELMSVRDKDKDMKFFIKEASGKVSDLVMVMGGNDEFALITLFGEIDLKKIGSIGKKMNIDGLDKLEKIHDGVKEGGKKN
jgi:hypothetical protein